MPTGTVAMPNTPATHNIAWKRNVQNGNHLEMSRTKRPTGLQVEAVET